MRSALKVAVAVLLLLGAAYLFVFPARTYLAQRQQISFEEHTVSVLQAANAKLASEKAALQDNSTIERLARQDYGLVKPGQQAYMVLPAPPVRGARHVAKSPVPHKPWYSQLEFWDHL